MNQNMQIQDFNNDEINLRELIADLKSGLHWIVAGGGLGLACATGLLFLTPPKYEATAVIQPGIISTSSSTTPVEPNVQILERLRLVNFYSDDTVQACRVDSPKDLVNGVRASIVKGSNLISIAYQADSAGVAEICIAKIFMQLSQIQKTIQAPLIKVLEDQRDSTKQQIDVAIPFLEPSKKQRDHSNELILEMLKRDEVRELKATYRELQIQLSEPFTRPMKLLEPIHSPKKAMNPKKLMLVVGGLISGVFVGMFALFIYRSWRHYRSMPV
jgi:LPS O-antigen subunit length determinant protein (WzzB/FepE family)